MQDDEKDRTVHDPVGPEIAEHSAREIHLLYCRYVVRSVPSITRSGYGSVPSWNSMYKKFDVWEIWEFYAPWNLEEYRRIVCIIKCTVAGGRSEILKQPRVFTLRKWWKWNTSRVYISVPLNSRNKFNRH